MNTLLRLALSVVLFAPAALAEPPEAGEIGSESESGPPPIDPDRYPTQNQLGTLCIEGEQPYRITPEDAESLAKVIDGETWGRPTYVDASMMLWTLAQRKGIGKFPGWTLKQLAQSYSQPINPIWLKTGSKCRFYYPAGNLHEGTLEDHVDDYLDEEGYEEGGQRDQKRKRLINGWKMCTEEKVNKRHDNIHNRPWLAMHRLAREVTLVWASGRIPLTDPSGALLQREPEAVGWFAPETWEKSKKGRRSVGSYDGNVYYANESWAETDGWNEHTVTVVPPDDPDGTMHMCPEFVGDEPEECPGFRSSIRADCPRTQSVAGIGGH